MHKGKRKWLCMDCKKSTSKMKEHYFVKNEVWLKAHNSEIGMLCIGCLEARLGRLLNRYDFPPVFLNNPFRNEMSTRLLDRIYREETSDV